MLAYGHGWEELEAEDQHVMVPILNALTSKEISVLYYHNKRVYTWPQAGSLELHIISLPKLATLLVLSAKGLMKQKVYPLYLDVFKRDTQCNST